MVQISPVLSPFVGRSGELRLLLDASAGLSNARGMAILVGGEAGVGKTRLVKELSRCLAGTHLLATGVCLEYARSALHPILEAIAQLREQRPDALAQLPRVRTALDRLTEAHAAGEAELTSSDRLRLFQTVQEALFRFAAISPVVVVIEDLQWADDATVALLLYLTAGMATKPITLLITHRTENAASPDLIGPFLRRVTRFLNVQRLILPVLSQSDIDEIVVSLLGSKVDRHTRIEIAKRAEGNALFAEELAKHVLSTDARRTGNIALPPTIQDAVRARLGGLAVADRSILLAAAVIGRSFDLQLLTAITNQSSETILRALRDASVADIIVEDAPPTFSFKHALFQEALYGDLLTIERQSLHGRILDELLTRDDRSDSALAYHAWAARSQSLSLRFNERAGDAARAAGAWIEASEYYDRAVDSTADESLLAPLCDKLGQALARGGFPDRALRVFLRSLELYERGGKARQAAAACVAIYEVFSSLGDDEAGIAYLERARDALAREPAQSAYVQAVLYTAHLEIWAGEVQAAVERLEALRPDIEGWRPDLKARFHATVADAHLVRREHDSALESQSEAVAAMPSSDPAHIEHAARLAELSAICARLSQAADLFDRAAMLATRANDTVRASLYRICRTEMLLMQGLVEPDLVRRELEDALAVAMRSDAPALALQTARVAIFYNNGQNDPELSAFVDRLVTLLEIEDRFRFSTDQAFFPLTGAFATWLISKNRETEAMEVLQRSVARLSRKRVRSTDWSLCTLVVTAARSDIANIPTVRDFLENSHSAFSAGFVALIDAIEAARCGRPADARPRALVAQAMLETIGMKIETAIAWELAGEPERAIEAFEAAQAPREAERVRRSLIPVNRRGRPSDALTEREREIADLICRGKSNRQIADALHITEKTVETHVGSIFNRLGVRSRREVSSRLRGPQPAG
jgi:DNA-binding NarL/FixJ family response regulator